MITRLIAVACLAVLAACGGSEEPAAKPTATNAPTTTLTSSNPQDELEDAVRDYSSAFLTGDGAKAYALLTSRCQEATALSDFAGITEQAADTYGEVQIASIDAGIDGRTATVTYTYPVATLNQTNEPWVDEGGWKNDDC